VETIVFTFLAEQRGKRGKTICDIRHRGTGMWQCKSVAGWRCLQKHK